MISLSLYDTTLSLKHSHGDLKPRDESQLAYWSICAISEENTYQSQGIDGLTIASKVISYFDSKRIPYQIDKSLKQLLAKQHAEKTELLESMKASYRVKSGTISKLQIADYNKLRQHLTRTLKGHQVKALIHLLASKNGANFSVPGSGKTTVVLAAYYQLKLAGVVDGLFVVGPPACFTPWKTEYREVLGTVPKVEIAAGGNIEKRQNRYVVNSSSVPDLFLTTYQTLQRDLQHVLKLFQKRGIRFFLVVDEAHYVKQIGGSWASAILELAKHATRRCVLTGTPFPRSFEDAFNLFDILWPVLSPISTLDRHRIAQCSAKKQMNEAASILDKSIGPLFYRVRKEDLKLSKQHFHKPILVRMKEREQHVYDLIAERIIQESRSDFSRDQELLIKLKKARMMRLRQCTSYAALMSTCVNDDGSLQKNESLAKTLLDYDDFETPAKIDALIGLISKLRDTGLKVVVWANFVRTLKLITKHLTTLGYRTEMIYGGTPFEIEDIEHELSREKIIREFVQPKDGIDILVANPAACAESVSLHKSCSHAVYYDLSYNCAQYLQSIDRIHRVGGSEKRPAHYYILQYARTIDQDILANLTKKTRNMSKVIDKEYAVYGLDMFEDDGDLEAYERLFGKTKH